MSTSTITTEGLADNIKGLGPAKADLIKSHIANHEGDVTVQSLAAIRGVSTALAKRVVNYMEAHAETHAAPQVDEPDTDEGTEPVDASTNGHHVTRTAGDARRFAREMEAYGYVNQANELRGKVSALLDDEAWETSNS